MLVEYTVTIIVLIFTLNVTNSVFRIPGYRWLPLGISTFAVSVFFSGSFARKKA